MRNSSTLVLGACLLVFSWSAVAEQASPPAEAALEKPNPTPTPSGLTRFDLSFAGGTPAELAAMISKAMGKRLNLIVPSEQTNVKIMPFQVANVTVPDLFEGISFASMATVAVPISNTPNSAMEYRKVSIQFLPVQRGPQSDEMVWAFRADGPELENIAAVVSRQTALTATVCRYFQLSPYLQNYSVEDITTAIRTGWETMRKKEGQRRTSDEQLREIDEIPQLSFHKETRLLIAVGSEKYVNFIPQVLNELQKDREPAVERIMKLQAEIEEAKAGNAPDADKKIDALRREIADLARRQKANEEIDNSGRRQIRPGPANNVN